MEAVVVDSTANSIVVEDLTGDLFEALGPEGRPIAGFVIFAFNDSKQANAPTYQTQGTWTSAPSYASNQTTFTDAEADDNGGGFAGWMIGSILVPDVNIGAPLLITGATATTLTVAGDARGVASNGVRYLVYAAPFTDPVRGTWQTDPHKGGTRYLWAGYRYQPPQMGFWVDPPGAAGLGIYGAATGTNRLGQYYCWNRTCDINLGRWTTPDPILGPNIVDYLDDSPLDGVDPTGLHFCVMLNDSFNDWLTEANKSGRAFQTENAAETCRRLTKAYDLVKNAPNHSLKGACMEEITKAWNNCPECSDPPPEMPEQLKPHAEGPRKSGSNSSQLAMFGLLYAESAAAGSKNPAGRRFAAAALVVIGAIMVQKAWEKRQAFEKWVEEMEKWAKRVKERAKSGSCDVKRAIDDGKRYFTFCDDKMDKCITYRQWTNSEDRITASTKCMSCYAY